MSPSPNDPLTLHFVDDSPVAGLALAERRVASPEATIICVHGGLDRAGSFRRLARRLEHFDVVAYDRRGYQGSRSLTPLSLCDHVEDLLVLARREGERAPVILFGHSFGGVVTMGAASREPSLARLVVVYEAPLPWVLARPSARPTPGDDPGAEVETFFKRMVSGSAWHRLSEEERQSRRLDGPALLADLTALREEPPFDLASLTTPLAYVHGDATLVDYYRALCAALQIVNPAINTIELTHAGHGAHLSKPDLMATVLERLWEQQCVLE
ncbi:MAG: alpha/beta hydrolase [Acidimicrobiales bacterium]